MKLADFVVTQAIVPELSHSDRDGVIEELVDALIEAGSIPETIRADLIKLIVDRETKGSTGFGKGVAVPHVKHPKIEKMVAAVGVSPAGVDFNSLDRGPVYSIFLLLSPEDQPDEHLQAMENIFSNLQKDTFRRFLRQSTTQEDVVELIHDADSQQLQG